MPLHCTTIQDVDRFELAAILAGLRLLQAAPALPPGIEKIATDCGDFEPLDDERIDALCERINTVSEYPWRDVTEDAAAGDAGDAELAARVASLFEEIER